MAQFYVSLSQNEMADQIATLLNTYNKLYKCHTAATICREKTDYFVEVVNDRVVGCVGLTQRDADLCEVRHACVSPDYQRKGIGKKLVELAIANCPTNYIYATIREDNAPSLKMVQSLGFSFVRKHWNVDHFVITVGRKRNHGSLCQQQHQ